MQENIGQNEEVKGTLVSPVRKKSRIPVPSPKKEHTILVVAARARLPLTPLQSSTLGNNSHSRMGGKGEEGGKVKVLSPAKNDPTNGGGKNKGSGANDTPRSQLSKSRPTFASTPIPGKAGMSKGQVAHKTDKGVQTDHPDLQMVTGDEPPPEYWKLLAETRREALAEALTENESLHERIEELEREKKELEDIVEEAKRLAEIITSVVPEHDSGIGTDESIASAEQSQVEDNE